MNAEGFSLAIEGFSLAGQLYVPQGSGPFPALCICHGVPRGGVSDPDDPGYPALAERFCEAGFATAIFNFRGSGESGGNFDILGWTRDLGAVLDHLAARRDVAGIAVMGFSGGAAVSVYVAASDHRVSSVIACACPQAFRWASDAEKAQAVVGHFRAIGLIRDEHFPASIEEWMEGMNRVRAIDSIDRIAPRPVLILHGSADEVVDPSHARALYERAGKPRELVIIEGAGHRLRRDERAMDTALAWLRRHHRA